MKFTNDRRPSLCIYSNGVVSSTDDKQMESSLKKELEVTKSALKLQTIRCRQLVAAFTRKLQEKEIELRASKDLRDQQLSRLLRALLILESRLKKEQKIIRQQLEEKDLIIERQEREISKYKRLDAWKNCISLESLGSETDKEGGERNEWSEQPNTTGEERLDNLCRRLNEQSMEECEEGDFGRRTENAYKDNPVLESVNQILLRDEEELLKMAKPVRINIGEKGVPAGGSEWYETDSSLIVPEERTETGAWCISVVEEELQEDDSEQKMKKDFFWREKLSPGKSQHLEEKACLEMSKKNLTIAQAQLDFEEIDAGSCDGTRSTASYQEILPVSGSPTYQSVRVNQKPPALPPKPARLLKPQQTRDQTVKTAEKVKIPQSTNALSQLPVSPRHRHPESKTRSDGKRNGQQNGDLEKPKKKKEESSIVANCGAIKIGTSVSSLITGSSGDTIVTELSREKADVGANDSHYVSQLVRQFEVMSKPETPTESEDGNELRRNFEEFKLEESYVDVGRHDGDGAETMVNHYASLKMSVPPPLPKDPPPSLDPESKIYETFLEMTGLSQKSILTPSRMLSNHRSCLKPKDVKHRNRVKAAAAIEKCGVSSVGCSTVKYWTEPFL